MKPRHALALALLSFPALAVAEPTLELYIRDVAEVLQGDPVSTAVDAFGRVSLGLAEGPGYEGTGKPATALAVDRGVAWVGTAGAGLYRVEGREARPVEGAGAPLVSAVAADGRTAWLATSPGAQVGRVRGGRVEPWAKLEAGYVWALLPDGDDRVVAATGAPATLVEVRKGSPEVMVELRETHLRAAVRHPSGGFVVGGGEKGVVYRVREADGAVTVRALYDSSLDEVTALVVDRASSDIFAAIVSGSEQGSTDPGTWIGPVGEEKPNGKSPFKGSEVVRIRADGDVDRLWTSKHEGALALAVEPEEGRLFIATGTALDGRARVYGVELNRRDRVVLLARLAAPIATGLVLEPSGALAVSTAPDGALHRLGPGLRREGTYRSVEQDLRRVARYGRLWFDADVPSGGRVEIRLRTGNTEEPDETWSSWSAPVRVPNGGDIEVPAGRYAQFQAQLVAGRDGRSPVLRSMHASVRRSNLAPRIGEIFPLRPGVYLRPLPPEAEDEKTTSVSSSTLRDLRARYRSSDRRPRVRAGQTPGWLTIAWTVSDPNGDDLLYDLALVAAGGRRTELGTDLEVPFHSFDARGFPDGTYRAEVRASDRPANAPAEALDDVLASEAFVIDHTPPRITEVETGRGRVRATVTDAASRLAEAYLSVDGGPWLAFPAEDGMLDEKRERLGVEVEVRAGAPVRVRVVDEAGNEATGGP